MIDIVNGLRRIAEEGYRFAGDAADEIERLRSRLEAAEKERDDVAQQLVQSEITRREISEAHNAVTRRLSVLADENTTLRAKIAEMEKQAPVRWGCTVLQVDGSWKEEIGIEEPPKDYFSIRNAFPLYALPVWGSQAVLDVITERYRQIEVEGWTPEHDDEHSAHALAEAAACYCLSSAGKPFDYFETVWPWERWWFKASGTRRDLVKAGALLLAEVERLDRAAEVGRKMK